jgi:hypothetical protein
MQSVMLHDVRQILSWLIFDIGRKKHGTREADRHVVSGHLRRRWRTRYLVCDDACFKRCIANLAGDRGDHADNSSEHCFGFLLFRTPKKANHRRVVSL